MMGVNAFRLAGVLFGPPNSGSFTDAGLRGLTRAKCRLGCSLDLHFCTEPSVAARIELLERIAATQPDLVIAHGGQGDAPVAAVAPHHPRVRFAVSQGAITGPNIASYEVRLEGAAFLAGALAALHSRSGVIAHLSGERVAPGLKGRDAFAAGAAHANPEVRLLSAFCGHQHDAAVAEAIADAQAAAGADVLFTMLGAGRAGAIASCRRNGMRQIGDGADWCAREPDVFIASAMADSAWGCHQAAADFAAEAFPAGEHRSVGLEHTDLCRLALGEDIDERMRAHLAALSTDITTGKVAIDTRWTGTEFSTPVAHAAGAR